ncbi:MAG: GNAT family N-acetyltransferase [Geminicoccaceae bacterium]
MPEVRAATRADAELIATFIREHAAYEGASEAVQSTSEHIAAAGFGERPAFECLIVEVEGKPAGFAMFFDNFSSWEGRRGLFLEDIYLHDWARGTGAGAALLRALASMVLDRGGNRLDLVVKGSNPATGFYRRMGLRQVPGWELWRADGAILETLADEALHNLRSV